MTKFIWIIGSPRSGTTFITDFLGKHVCYKYDETWNTHPPKKINLWKFPQDAKTIVFKQLGNYVIADEIIKRFPDSKFLHMIRNPTDTVYSMMFPKKDAYPFRDFKELDNKILIKRFENVVNKWYNCTKGSLELENNKDYKYFLYEKLDMENIEKFLDIKLNKQEFNFKNRNLINNRLIEYWNQYPMMLDYKKYIENRFYVKKKYL